MHVNAGMHCMLKFIKCLDTSIPRLKGQDRACKCTTREHSTELHVLCLDGKRPSASAPPSVGLGPFLSRDLAPAGAGGAGGTGGVCGFGRSGGGSAKGDMASKLPLCMLSGSRGLCGNAEAAASGLPAARLKGSVGLAGCGGACFVARAAPPAWPGTRLRRCGPSGSAAATAVRPPALPPSRSWTCARTDAHMQRRHTSVLSGFGCSLY